MLRVINLRYCLICASLFCTTPALVKCKGCGRVNDISILDEENEEAACLDCGSGDDWQRIATFECRGVDLVR